MSGRAVAIAAGAGAAVTLTASMNLCCIITSTLNAAPAPSPAPPAAPGTLRHDGTDTVRRVLSGPLTGDVTVVVASPGGRVELDGASAGAGRLIKSGPGTLVLPEGVRPAGGLELAGGVTEVRSAGAVDGGVRFVGTGAVLRPFGSMTITAGLWRCETEGTLDVPAGGELTLSAELTGTDPSSRLVKTGPGLLRHEGKGRLAGGVVIREGVLAIRRGESVIAGEHSPREGIVFDGGTVRLEAAGPGGDERQIHLGPIALVVRTGGGVLDTADHTNVFIGGRGDAGWIRGTGTLRKVGPGQLVGAGDCREFTGTLVIESGTIRVTHARALGSIDAGTQVGRDAMLELHDPHPDPEPVTLAGTLRSEADHRVFAGRITLVGRDARIRVDTGSFRLQGVVEGTDLRKTGGGTLTLDAVNTFRGTMSVEDGDLRILNPSALVVARLDRRPGDRGRVRFDVGEATLGALAGVGDLVLDGRDGRAVVLTVGGNGDDTRWAGRLMGAGTLRKAGGGRMVIAADQRHTGGTEVLGGVMVLDGSGTPEGPVSPTLGGGTVSVHDGAALEGDGRMTGSLEVRAGGRLSTGTRTGMAVQGDVRLAAGAVLAVTIGEAPDAAEAGVAAVSGGAAPARPAESDPVAGAEDDRMSDDGRCGGLTATRIRVSGGARLELRLAPGVAESLRPRARFVVVRGGELTGAFGGPGDDGRLATAGGEGSFAVMVTAGSVVLSDWRPAGGGIPVAVWIGVCLAVAAVSVGLVIRRSRKQTT